MSKPTPESTPAGSEKPSAPKKPRPPRKRLPLMGLAVAVALIVALAALAGSAYTWWRARDVVDRANQVPALQQTIARQKAALAGLQQRLESMAGKFATKDQTEAEVGKLNRQAQGALADVGARLDRLASDTRSAIARLQRAVGEPRAGAHIADAAYLLRVARHQARIRHDPTAMRAALSGARQALAHMNDPAARALREQIAAALAALGKAPANPADDAARKLVALASRVDHLPIETPADVVEPDRHAPPPEAQHWWQRIGAGLANAFDDLVTVRHVGRDVQPLLAPEQRWFLYRNLSLELDAARIAALKGDAEAYRASIERARGWLGQYFDASNPKVKAALATLAQLHDTRLEPELPDLTDAFDALARLRRQADAAP